MGRVVRRSVNGILFLLVAIGLPCGGVWLALTAMFHDYEYTVATLDCGPGRQIILTTWSLHEGVADLSYRVRVNGREVVPPSHTGARGDFFWEGQGRDDRLDFTRLHFATVPAAGGQLVGVVAREFPYTVIVVHDFTTGESWPAELHSYGNHAASRGTLHDGRRRMQALRERLEADHPRLSPAAKVDDAGYLEGREDIDLSYSRAGDAELARLVALTTLRTLRLEGSRVTDKGLGHLSGHPGLRTVFVSHTAVTDDGLTHLHRVDKLRHVWVTGSQVTEHGVAALQKGRPGIEVWWRAEPEARP